MHHPRNPKRGRNRFLQYRSAQPLYMQSEMHMHIWAILDKPFIQCEFVHAMGNGPGDIKDYYQLEEQYDTFVGGFVWEWCDHGYLYGNHR